MNYESLYLSPRRPPPYKTPIHEWMPGAIFLVLHAMFFVLGIIEGLGQ